MTFQALIVLKGSVRVPTILFVVIFGHVLCKMDNNVLNAMSSLGIKEIKSVMRGREMTIHAVGHKPLGIVHMGRSFPGIVSELNFMTGGAKLGCRGPDHCIIGDTKNRKSDNNAQNNKNRRQ